MKEKLAQIREFIRKHRLSPFIDVLLFMLITIAFHKLWWANYKLIAETPVIHVQDWLARQAYLITLWIDTSVFRLKVIAGEPNFYYFVNGGSFYVNESCSGFKQFYQVAVLFILFPGPWRHKLWFIPMGMMVMFLTNVFRLSMLSVIMDWKPEYWHFSHDWILRPFFYVVLFFLWVWWIEKYRYRNKKQKLPVEAAEKTELNTPAR